MKIKSIIVLSFLFSICTGCKSQSKSPVSKSAIDTARIYISGTIRDEQTKEFIPFASFSISKIDTGNIWQASVRKGVSDVSGNFKVDITSLVDSTKTLVIHSKYIRYALTKIIIKGKIKKLFWWILNY